ncbi:MAG TPA: PQQ-dependent sugar dehydrogenase [Candidatus Nanoarchaeia archaeon]|nr:PQQ-dependent sugar dehydrogenase [Candidatus Nanoarchaeia archaeon]
MRLQRLFCILACTAVLSSLALSQSVNESGFVDENYTNVGSTPIGFQFAPDGRMFVWFKKGQVKIFKNGAFVSTFLDISSRVNYAVDRGLIGFTLDPNFASNGYVYLAYVYEPTAGQNGNSGGRTQRVSRFQADPANPNKALSSETVLLGKVSTYPCPSGADCIPNDAAIHTIDHLAFGPDGKLYVSMGDGAYNSVSRNSLGAQDLNVFRSKLLRVNKDGSAPGDNPFDDGSNSNRSKVLNFGLRNPYRFSFTPDGVPIIGDVGWTKYEEIDRGRGRNFGWPCFEGATANGPYQTAYSECRALSPGAVTNPIIVYDRGTGATVIGGSHYTASVWPSRFHGNYFYADYVQKWIKRAIFDSTGKVTEVRTFATGQQGPVYLDFGPDGHLYYVAIYTGQVRRIRFTGATNQPPIAKASASPTAGASPLTVSFSSAGSADPDGGSLTYSWDFGDGETSTAANPVHTYTSSTFQTFTASLTVTDNEGSRNSDTVSISVGDQPPVPVISSPADGSSVKVGDTVNFSGSASDPEDGSIPASSLEWDVILNHDTHTHEVTSTTGTSGSFVVQDHDPTGVYSYDVVLTATDSKGVRASTKVRLPVQTSGSGGCSVNPTNNTLTICTPSEGASLPSPVRLVAVATSNLPVTGMHVYVDGTLTYRSNNTNSVDTSLNLSAGTHAIIVQAWNTAGTLMKATRTITVTSGTGGGTGCTPSTVNNTLTVCSPSEGATVPSPVHVLAQATSSLPVTAMRIYVDSIQVYQNTNTNKLDTYLSLSPGPHFLVVQAWNSGGTLMRVTRNITVGSGSSGCELSTVPNTMTICQPTDGAMVGRPVRVVAGATSSLPIVESRIYANGAVVYKTTSSRIDTSLNLAPGRYQLAVQAWNSAGTVIKKVIYVTVQ